MTTFLQNTKRRHRQYMHACARKLNDLDAELEEQLLGQATVTEVTPDFKCCTALVLPEQGSYVIACCMEAQDDTKAATCHPFTC